MANDALRGLPAVDGMLQHPAVRALAGEYGRPLTVATIRAVLENTRQTLLESNGEVPPPTSDELARQIADHLQAQVAPTLHSLINATGVIIHTNLGRAPLSEAAQQAMLQVAQGYSTLEYDLAAGQRGKRSLHAAGLIKELTGAAGALIVNNNASAVLLILTALAQQRGVVISRGQLIEIGGGFRIPDVMRQSGAKLVEVGTTNRTHLRDYEQAIADEENDVALLLRAHHSNFRIIGFTTEPTAAELVALGQQHNLPVVEDLGSGTLLDTAAYGLGHEPTIQETLATGVDLVSFSGDKLLGGPQAGIIVGRADLVSELARYPLTRAIRPDKLCLAALTATLLHYLKDEAPQQIPVWQMISLSLDDIEARGRALAEPLKGAGLEASLIAGQSTVGGGSLPEETLPTRLVALHVPKPDQFAECLRRQNVVARIQDERVVFDPRTVLPAEDDRLLAAIRRAARRD